MAAPTSCFCDPLVNGSHYNYCQQQTWHWDTQVLGNNFPEVFFPRWMMVVLPLESQTFPCFVSSPFLRAAALAQEEGSWLLSLAEWICIVVGNCGRLWAQGCRHVLYLTKQLLGVDVGLISNLVWWYCKGKGRTLCDGCLTSSWNLILN